jgi:nitric oxide synthase oxygenase domain/subunit
MTWKAFHNRGEVVRSVIAESTARRDGILPMDVPGVAEHFHDELDLLGALQLKWHTRLAGHIERELSVQPMDLRASVVNGWARTAEELPGVRLILDHYRSHPVDDAMAQAVARMTSKEHHYLAAMAGRASVAREEGQAVGAEIENLARSTRPAAPAVEQVEEGRRRPLIERLRAVVAA